MVLRNSCLFPVLRVGACCLVLLAGLGCAGSPPTEAEEGTGDATSVNDSTRAAEQAAAVGVTFEVTPEAIVLQAEEEGAVVVRASQDLETWVVERLPPGEAAAYHRDQQVSVFRHLATFPLDCKPGACPTPKPIPLAGGHGVPGAEGRPERTQGGLVTCFCDDPITRREDSACYEECKGKPIRLPG